jgi:hypothetical protein
MFQITDFYPFFWAVCGGLATFTVIMLDIHTTEIKAFFTKRRIRLRDKLHFAMTQTVKRVAV